ncbi:hypothetical protein BDD12DRAFT_854372 [Trichophaea hybrida]|nr:hypothetical protein BDD12DRAFT_854372 [Trichophaea hybrida]
MLTFTIKVLAVLAILGGSGAMAAENQQIKARSLVERQSDQSFVPDTNPLSGTCAENGLQDCIKNVLCFDPSQGQTCCHSKWGCPTGSFCLIDGKCCPDGLDPQKCAAENGVTLPADFTTETASSPLPAPTDVTTVDSITPKPKTTSPPKKFTGTTIASVTSTPTISSPPAVYTNKSMYTNVSSSPTISSPSAVFTGGANGQAMCGLVAAAVVALGLVGNIV